MDNVTILEDGVSQASLVDPETPANAQPLGVSGDWVLDFSDEFNGEAGDPLNPLKWMKSVSTSSRTPRPFQEIDDWWWREDHVSLNGVGQLDVCCVRFGLGRLFSRWWVIGGGERIM